MTLIIAEKPSLARNIVAGIGKMNKHSGYFEGCDYIVTWAFGHLFSLYDIEDYISDKSKKENDLKIRWTLDNLPCFPKEFCFKLKCDENGKPDEGVKKQFEIIKTLCMRTDVDCIVNAGDSDREGEIIVRLCISHALENKIENKKLVRLWLPDQTEETIKTALYEMKDESEYSRLADEGFARTYIDWLYGVNLTRYATLKTGTLLRVGRVIVPIVKAIYDRDMEIRNFVPDIYYVAASKEETNGALVELISKTKFDKNQLDKVRELCDKYNASEAIVTSCKTKKDTVSPGKLYSLSKLQNVLGKRYKMSMEQSLKIVQKLYEEGYVTYPRTNSEYLAEAEKDRIKQILTGVEKLGYPVEFKNKKTIFDDTKIESHSALTPTAKIPKSSSLSADELKVYQTIFRRFAAVFCSKPCIVERSEIKIEVGKYEVFSLKGTVIIEPGWTKYDNHSMKDKILPPLKKGDSVNIKFEPREKETSPPKHYTIETLNNYLKNPFREDKAAAKSTDQASGDPGTDSAPEDDSEDYRAIFEGLELGTEATRTGIINNARKSKYIQLKKDVYTILPDGEFLIDSLKSMQISMDKYKTSTLGQALKKVYRGDISVDECVLLAEKEISEIFARPEDLPPELDCNSGFYGDTVGKCPLCGRDVVRGKYSYGCKGYKDGCGFKVGINICGRVISVSNIKLLLETGHTAKIQGFISKKSGKSFDASLKLDNGKAVFDFSGPNSVLNQSAVLKYDSYFSDGTPMCSSRYAQNDITE